MIAACLPWLHNFDFESMTDVISLNLNISTVLSREFQTFHRSVGSNARKIVVELQLIDVFADLGMYVFARDQLRDTGYRILIDGLNPVSFQFFNPSLLDADFVKLGWSKEFLGEVPKARFDDMRQQVDLTGKNKMVLSRVDSEGAILWGFQVGIHRLEEHKDGRRLVHLHLSALRPFNRREHHIRAAVEDFEPFVSSLEGSFFSLKMRIFFSSSNKKYCRRSKRLFNKFDIFSAMTRSLWKKMSLTFNFQIGITSNQITTKYCTLFRT